MIYKALNIATCPSLTRLCTLSDVHDVLDMVHSVYGIQGGWF